MSGDDDERRSERASRVSRRDFLRAAGAGTAVGALYGVVPFSASSASSPRGWDRECDVLVLGSGAGALPAALFAAESGARVVILEKGPFLGGTTFRSGGVYWIPNNSLMRSRGLADPRPDALRYMARLAHPDHYTPVDPRLGLSEHQYQLITTYYDRAPEVLDDLEKMGALRSTFWLTWDGEMFPDYYAELPEDRAPRGRALVPRLPDGSPGVGVHLIGQLKEAIDQRGIPVLLNHGARRLVTNDADEVVGVEATNGDGESSMVRARKAVIFGIGGFTHNAVLVNNFLRGPVYASCEVLTNEGDFVRIAGARGAQLANMKNAAWKEVGLERALVAGIVPVGVASVPGDSAILVNLDGERVVNEKLNYHQRSQVHFDWDARRNVYRNQFLFLVYDERTANAFAGLDPIPTNGATAPYVISGQTFRELSIGINERLADLEPRIPRFRLDERFGDNLAATIGRYNQFADNGIDADYHRGEALHEFAFHGPRRSGNDKPNPTMYPISETGPYHAIILAAGSYGTRGGPKINSLAQVLDTTDRPIPGLYGAGNCVASPVGGGYWGGGSLIGPAMVFSAIAGRQAAQEPVKQCGPPEMAGLKTTVA